LPAVNSGSAIAATSEGFYLFGIPTEDVTLLGRAYRANVLPSVLAYVPRSTSELAWTVAIDAHASLTALTGGDAVIYAEYGPQLDQSFVRYSPDGMQRPQVPVVVEDQGQNFIFARPGGGFMRVRRIESPSVPVSGFVTGRFGAYVHDAPGQLTEIVRLADYTRRLLDERSDRESWLVVEESGRVFEVDRGPTRTELATPASGDYFEQIAFDESGVAVLSGRELLRWRDGVQVERVALNAALLGQGVVWTVEDTTVGRIDLPPIR
jgi:hypothetical protein